MARARTEGRDPGGAPISAASISSIELIRQTVLPSKYRYLVAARIGSKKIGSINPNYRRQSGQNVIQLSYGRLSASTNETGAGGNGPAPVRLNFPGASSTGQLLTATTARRIGRQRAISFLT
jgi:hypothetical protein